MKKALIIIGIALIVILGVSSIFSKKSAPADLVNYSARVLGISADATQQFNATSGKVGFHVYYPTSLPDGFSLNGVTVNTLSNGEVDYAIASADGGKRFIIAERASSTPNSVGGNIMLSPDDLKALRWNITNPTVNGVPATLGQAPASGSGPQGHEDLIYTTKDGVVVEIFDDFGYGQLVQVAQSLQ